MSSKVLQTCPKTPAKLHGNSNIKRTIECQILAVLSFPVICCWRLFNFIVRSEEREIEGREKSVGSTQKRKKKKLTWGREMEQPGEVGSGVVFHRSALWPQSNLQEASDRHVVAIWPGLPCYYASWFIPKCWSDWASTAGLALFFCSELNLSLRRGETQFNVYQYQSSQCSTFNCQWNSWHVTSTTDNWTPQTEWIRPQIVCTRSLLKK